MAPELNVMEISHSYVKLHWDEIPLQQRNGIIQGYTVYFQNETNNIEGIRGFNIDNIFLDGSKNVCFFVLLLWLLLTIMFIFCLKL